LTLERFLVVVDVLLAVFFILLLLFIVWPFE
jgi:hypothetical protein